VTRSCRGRQSAWRARPSATARSRLTNGVGRSGLAVPGRIHHRTFLEAVKRIRRRAVGRLNCRTISGRMQRTVCERSVGWTDISAGVDFGHDRCRRFDRVVGGQVMRVGLIVPRRGLDCPGSTGGVRRFPPSRLRSPSTRHPAASAPMTNRPASSSAATAIARSRWCHQVRAVVAGQFEPRPVYRRSRAGWTPGEHSGQGLRHDLRLS
jgi:hypothetical protein